MSPELLLLKLQPLGQWYLEVGALGSLGSDEGMRVGSPWCGRCSVHEKSGAQCSLCATGEHQNRALISIWSCYYADLRAAAPRQKTLFCWAAQCLTFWHGNLSLLTCAGGAMAILPEAWMQKEAQDGGKVQVSMPIGWPINFRSPVRCWTNGQVAHLNQEPEGKPVSSV